MVLSDLKMGNKAVIKNMNVSKDIKRRLLDMGMVENTEIECLFTSLFKNPVAYLVRGTVIAMRKSITDKIVVDML